MSRCHHGSLLGVGPDELPATNDHIHTEIMAVPAETSDAEATLV